MAQYSITEARAALPEVLDQVARGEEVVITGHGRPVAVVVRPDALRVRRADAALASARGVADLLAAAREQPLAPAQLTTERADELADEVRAGRDHP